MTIVTADNHGPLINVGMWVALAPTIITVLLKVYSKWNLAGRIHMDDVFIVLSLLAATAQTVATTEEVHYGLGRNQDTLTSDQVNSVFLSEYVAQIFYVIAIYLSKLTGLYFFIQLAGPPSRKLFVKSLVLLILVWTAIALFTISFRCHTPNPWLVESGGCIDETAFWVVNAIVDVVTQLFVGLLPVFLLASLQAQRSKKLLSMVSFMPNLLTIPLAIIRLVYIFLTPRFGNYTWSAFTLTLVTALHAVLSVFLAGLPFSKPFLDSMILEPMALADGTHAYVATKERPSTVKTNQNTNRLYRQSRSVLDSLTQWSRERPGATGHFTNISVAEQELQDYERREGSQDRIYHPNGALVIHQTRSTTVTSTRDVEGGQIPRI